MTLRLFALPATFPILALAACGGTTSPTSPILPPSNPPTPQTVYIPAAMPNNTGAILQVSADADGHTVAGTLLTDATAGLGSLCADAAGNFYALEVPPSGTAGGDSIVEYAANGLGAAAPLRRITGTATAPLYVSALAIDPAGEVVAGTNAEIDFYGSAASGVATPVRRIGGPTTGIYEAFSMAFDSAGNLYVLNFTSTTADIRVFPAGASGNVAPARVLTVVPYNTQPYSLTVDALGDLYVTMTYVSVDAKGNITGLTPSVVEFAPGANGNATPIRTISPPGMNLLFGGLALDAQGGVHVVAGDLLGTGSGYLLKFAAGASGAVGPVADATAYEFGYADGSLVIR